MILSERAAIMEDAMDKLKAGDVVDAVVRNLVPYGAFVSIKDPQTSELTGGHVSLLLLMFHRHPALMRFSRNGYDVYKRCVYAQSCCRFCVSIPVQQSNVFLL